MVVTFSIASSIIMSMIGSPNMLVTAGLYDGAHFLAALSSLVNLLLIIGKILSDSLLLLFVMLYKNPSKLIMVTIFLNFK